MTSTARSDAFISIDREKARLATLRSQYVLESPTEVAFETLAHTARLLTGAPIALVSLVEEDTQYFKAACGVELESTARDISFCTHAVEADDVLEVCDAKADIRFRDNPLVTGEPNIRYYLGVPIRGYNGLAIGTLCVIDNKPRLPLRDTELEGLVQLARCVEALMEQNRKLRVREAQLNDIEVDIDAIEEALVEQAEMFQRTVSSVRDAFAAVDRAVTDSTPRADDIRRALEQGRRATEAFASPTTKPTTWEELVAHVGDALGDHAALRNVNVDVEQKPVDGATPPDRACRIIGDVVSASIDASPRGATIGLRLKSDPYFVAVSVYREHAGLQIVKPGDQNKPLENLDDAVAEATEAMIALGGYLEEKPWSGGKVLKLWFPRT
jgi:hypothetical protein